MTAPARSTTLAPRVVIVHRRTEREQIVRERGTWAQARFQAKPSAVASKALVSVDERHEATERALQAVSAAIPAGWRRGGVEREDLDRFLFEPEDLVVVVGQDGLVANVAKYLDGQPVVGIDPTPGSGLGVLTRHRAADCERLLEAVVGGRAALQERTMVEAVVDGPTTGSDSSSSSSSNSNSNPGSAPFPSAALGPAPASTSGLGLTALNEIYLGSPSHQSARYVLTLPDGRTESQSSSGVLAGTGTGATGWLLSVARERHSALPLPPPTARRLGWFVREAWPSPSTGADLTEGLVDENQSLTIQVRSESLVLFGDGMEADRVTLAWGQTVAIAPARRTLNLIV